jgi:hypothetical protein
VFTYSLREPPGKVDLATGALDIHFKTQMTKRFFSITPFHVGGTFMDPKVSLEPLRPLQRALMR